MVGEDLIGIADGLSCWVVARIVEVCAQSAAIILADDTRPIFTSAITAKGCLTNSCLGEAIGRRVDIGQVCGAATGEQPNKHTK